MHAPIRAPAPHENRGWAATSPAHRLLVLAASALAWGRRQWSSDRLSRRALRRARRFPDAAPADASPPRWFARDLRVTRSEAGGWPVWELRSKDAGPIDRVIVYFHGGAYIGRIGLVQWAWISRVARRTGALVRVPLYPLAPRGTASTTVPAAADVVSQTIAEHGPDAVAVAGDSAGGGLALAALQELVRRGHAPPARALLVSPWLDVGVSDPRSARIPDPLLRVPGLRAAGSLWAAERDPGDPLPSPLYGSLAGLPPTVLVAGTRDILFPDAARLARRAAQEGAPIEVTIRRGLVHDWPLVPGLPEAEAVWPLLRDALVGGPHPHTAPGVAGRK